MFMYLFVWHMYAGDDGDLKKDSGSLHKLGL